MDPGPDANSTDGDADVTGADGFGSIAWTGAVAGSVAGLYGTLTVDAAGNYSYALDNGLAAVQGLAAGESLQDAFTYTLTDGDGDTSLATLTLTINGTDDGVTITGIGAAGGDETVDEDDLADGSSPNAAALTQTGTFNISAPDGFNGLTIGVIPVVTNGVVTIPALAIPTTYGALKITNVDLVTGVVSYSYTLSDNTLAHGPANNGENFVLDNISVVLTDTDGSRASDTLIVKVVDDVPTADDDLDSVTEDGPLVATGNVITAVDPGPDANSTDGDADVTGADGFGSIAWTGAVAGSVAGLYGTLTVDAAGNYSYALDNGLAAVQGLAAGESLQDAFTYTLTDGDGDTSLATLTLTINGTDDGVTITGIGAAGGDETVDEDDLADGSSPNAAALTQTGTFNISAPDGFNGLTIGVIPVVTNGVVTIPALAIPTTYGALKITNVDLVTGVVSYSYTLSDNAVAQGSDVLDNISVVLTDTDGSSASETLIVKVVDDVPIAAPAGVSVVPTDSKTNVMLILDLSGSMGSSSGLTGLTRLDVAKAAVSELLDQYDNRGDVMVRIVWFSDSALANSSVNGSAWLNVADAKTVIDHLSLDDPSAGGSTNYDAALLTAMQAFTAGTKLSAPGTQNVSYFISDGEPTSSSPWPQIPGSQPGTGFSRTNKVFGSPSVNNNNIVSFALGISNVAPPTVNLNPIAFDPARTQLADTPIRVTDLGQLADTLVFTIPPVAASVLTGVGGSASNSFGGDGGFVQSIIVNGVTYTFDPSANNGSGGVTTSGGGTFSFDASTKTLTVDTDTSAAGGELAMVMTTGTFTFQPTASFSSLTVAYVLVDHDGDTASSTLNLTASAGPDHPPIVRDDHVITNISGGSGTNIVIPDYALLYNDSDADSQTIAITDQITNKVGAISVAHASGNVTFTDDNTPGGSFTYTGSTASPSASDTGNVTVARNPSTTYSHRHWLWRYTHRP